ncbi:MAG: hypothetical protein Q7S00_06540 [bacterium]|nr:hypothetical protein [bacterium]
MTLVEKLIELQKELDWTTKVRQLCEQLAEKFAMTGMVNSELVVRSADAEFTTEVEYEVESSHFHLEITVHVGFESALTVVEDSKVDPRFVLVVTEVLGDQFSFRLGRLEYGHRVVFMSQAIGEMNGLPFVVEMFHHEVWHD